ncbi:glycosyltransferase family 2 protein [Cytobacillus sp. BC1816]|uniref:glycosyltransferase family 2 protein n=1 Tax=Cytobacillus sp. BC1816 TaxID=3440154 RepID=UPI003F5159DF
MESSKYPLVSIIIPFYNCQYVSRAISSALNQTYQNIEIIVVDDGSTKHLAALKHIKKKIRYIKKKNGGTASALNEGIKISNGDYIAWLSSDDLFLNTKIELQIKFMKERDCKFSYTNYFCIDNKDRIISQALGPSNISNEELLFSLSNGCPINGSTIMMRREVVKSVGLFNESLIYANDYDYWIRVYLKYQICHLNNALTLYRVHREMGTKLHNNDVLKESAKVKLQYQDLLNENSKDQ